MSVHLRLYMLVLQNDHQQTLLVIEMWHTTTQDWNSYSSWHKTFRTQSRQQWDRKQWYKPSRSAFRSHVERLLFPGRQLTMRNNRQTGVDHNFIHEDFCGDLVRDIRHICYSFIQPMKSPAGGPIRGLQATIYGTALTIIQKQAFRKAL
jgi:hypothetical protein